MWVALPVLPLGSSDPRTPRIIPPLSTRNAFQTFRRIDFAQTKTDQNHRKMVNKKKVKQREKPQITTMETGRALSHGSLGKPLPLSIQVNQGRKNNTLRKAM